MLNPFWVYTQYFFAFILLLTVFIALGWAAIRFYNKNQQWSVENIFHSSLLGSIIVVSGYSLFKTHFQSINCLFLLILFFLIAYRKKITATAQTNNIQPITIVKTFALCSVLAVLTYTIFFVILYDFKTNTFNPSFIDDYFYAAVSRSMVDNGVENLTYALNYFEKNTGNVFYHYYELWIASIVYDVFQLNAYLALRLVLLPLLIFNFLLGLIAITEHIFKASNQIKYYALGIFAFGVIEFASPIQGLPILQYYHEEIIFGISPFKHSTILIFALVVLLSLYKKQYLQGFMWLVSMPILCFTTLPFVTGACLLLFYIALALRIFKKQDHFLLYSSYYLPLHLVPLGIFIFYAVFAPNEPSIQGLDTPFIIQNAVDYGIETLRNLIKLNIVSFFPFLLLLVLLVKYDKIKTYEVFKPIFLIVVLGTVAGFVAAVLSYRDINAKQLLRLPFMPFMRIFFVFVAIYAARQWSVLPQKGFKYALAFAAFCTFINIFSLPQYIVIEDSKVDAEFIKAATAEKGDFLVQLSDTSEVPKPFWNLGWHTHRYTVLDAYERNTFFLNMTDLNSLIQKNKNVPNDVFPTASTYNFYNIVQFQNPFARFVVKQKQENKYVSINDSQIDFMRAQKVRRILVSGKYQPSEQLKSYIQKIIVEKNNLYKLLIVDFR
jgi:hypothetical protein